MHPMKKVNGLRLALYAFAILAIGSYAAGNAGPVSRTLASALLPSASAPEAPGVAPDAEREERSIFLPAKASAPQSLLYAANELNFDGLKPLSPSQVDNETLWLARCIYSETKRDREQELVAWVIRNRVETRFRGRRSYRDAVLDPFQFSAFNPDTPSRDFYSRLTPHARYPGWQKALRIAYEVRHADEAFRPFSGRTRHFYSEQSMAAGLLEPSWAEGYRPVLPEREYRLNPRRFRFYEGVR